MKLRDFDQLITAEIVEAIESVNSFNYIMPFYAFFNFCQEVYELLLLRVSALLSHLCGN